MSRELLTTLRERVRRIERPAATAHGVVPFGVAAIDRALPDGGLARGALHEILGKGGDEEDGALPAAFAAGILGRLANPPASPSQPRTRPGPSLSPPESGEDRDEVRAINPMRGGIVLWCLPRPDLYGPGLAAHGLDPGRLVLVRASRDADILWAMEEGLRDHGIAAVVGEVGRLPMVASRRLQLAAERSGVTALLLRRWRNGVEAARERGLPNTATTRWRIAALPSPSPHLCFPARGFLYSPISAIRHPRENGDPEPVGTLPATLGPRFRGGDGNKPSERSARGGGLGWGPRGREWEGGGSAWRLGIGRPRWRVELLRCRGGEPASWEVEVTDATGSLSLAEALADRSDAPRRDDAVAPEKSRAESFRGEKFHRAG